MAQVANMLLKNYANTDQTFAPDIVRSGEYAKYADRSQGTFVGTAYASLTRKINPAATGTRKIQAKLVYPVVDAASGLLKYQLLGTIECVTPNASSLADRRELYARLVSLVGHAVFAGAVRDDEMPWG